MGRCTSRNGPIPINQISVVAAMAIAKLVAIALRLSWLSLTTARAVYRNLQSDIHGLRLRVARAVSLLHTLHLIISNGVAPALPGMATTSSTAAKPLILLEIEVPPCHLAGIISRQTSSANVRPHSVDRACRGDAYLSHKRRTAVTAASHMSEVAIDIGRGDSVEIGVAF